MKNRFGFLWSGIPEEDFRGRPRIGRRMFFRHMASAAGGCFLLPSPAAASPAGKAKSCIFILMAGGPSHADTFDLKEGPWTPAEFHPESFGGLRFPRGLMPKLAGQLDSIALLRSVRAWSAAHGLAQNLVRIGWDPASVPGFVSLGATGGAGRAESDVYCRRVVGPNDGAALNCVPTLVDEEKARYGNSPFGDACITARNLIKARSGARFVEITIGGWDSHGDIYSGALNATNENSVARRFDSGLGALLADLKSDGLLSETLVVAMGEFGRTVGPLNERNGRDHFLRQSVLMAGAGIRGGRAIGATDAEGREIVEPGWSRNRDIHPEDIEATVYSALGINWTTARHDDPLGRGFYGPVQELWT